MKSILLRMIAATCLLAAGAASAAAPSAADVPALLKKSMCMGCHSMVGKLVGPGFLEVANKYKGDAGAAAKLEVKISKGGAGVWGTMPMPAMNANVKTEDIKVMVAFILSTAK